MWVDGGIHNPRVVRLAVGEEHHLEGGKRLVGVIGYPLLVPFRRAVVEAGERVALTQLVHQHADGLGGEVGAHLRVGCHPRFEVGLRREHVVLPKGGSLALGWVESAEPPLELAVHDDRLHAVGRGILPRGADRRE